MWVLHFLIWFFSEKWNNACLLAYRSYLINRIHPFHSSPDIILSGWLGSKHQLTNSLSPVGLCVRLCLSACLSVCLSVCACLCSCVVSVIVKRYVPPLVEDDLSVNHLYYYYHSILLLIKTGFCYEDPSTHEVVDCRGKHRLKVSSENHLAFFYYACLCPGVLGTKTKNKKTSAMAYRTNYTEWLPFSQDLISARHQWLFVG